MADQAELELQIGDLERQLDDVRQELIEAKADAVRESRAVTAHEVEAGLYRSRYYRLLARLGDANQAVTVANAASEYIDAIERDDGRPDVDIYLTVLIAEVHSKGEFKSPAREHIVELERELETLRSRIEVLQGECLDLRFRAEDLEGTAADWQDLAESADRSLVEAQQRLRKWELWPAELRHALGHVAECEDNCDLCRKIASDALTNCSPLE